MTVNQMDVLAGIITYWTMRNTFRAVKCDDEDWVTIYEMTRKNLAKLNEEKENETENIQ